MSKKKILLCGSAGFLGSNFIRYLLYRTKEYDIISVDNLYYKNIDYKRIYLNKKHKFYIGNLQDIDFITKLIGFEKPNIIINTINCNNMLHHRKEDSLNIFKNLLKIELPIIQIIPSVFLDKFNLWSINEFSHDNVLFIEVPNCFGTRQRPHFNHPNGLLLQAINNTYRNEPIFASKKEASWINANDLASFIWFSIEYNLKGYKKIPIIGKISMYDIALLIENICNKKINIIEKEDNIIDYEYIPHDIDNWVQDMTLEASLTNTIKWYNVNTWSLSISTYI